MQFSNNTIKPFHSERNRTKILIIEFKQLVIGEILLQTNFNKFEYQPLGGGHRNYDPKRYPGGVTSKSTANPLTTCASKIGTPTERTKREPATSIERSRSLILAQKSRGKPYGLADFSPFPHSLTQASKNYYL
jgi:hypothetical protein